LHYRFSNGAVIARANRTCSNAQKRHHTIIQLKTLGKQEMPTTMLGETMTGSAGKKGHNTNEPDGPNYAPQSASLENFIDT
jgi:hypothetical protein